MERLLWLLLVCAVGGGANWYYLSKYQPQIDAAQQALANERNKEDAQQAAWGEKDRALAELQTKFDTVNRLSAEEIQRLADQARKMDAMTADYEAKIQALAAKPPPSVPNAPDASPSQGRVPPTGTPVPVNAPANAAPKGPSDSDLKQIADLKADILAAQAKLQTALADLKAWDGSAFVDDDGMLHFDQHFHRTTTNAVGEINAARKRIKDDQAELAGLQGSGG